MKNKLKTLCIISTGYPYENNPEYTFVDQLVSEFADNNIKCIVIAPCSFTKHILKKNKMPPRKSYRVTSKGNQIEVLRPRYLSFSYKLFKIDTAMLTYHNFRRVVLREIEKLNIVPDAIYGHFIALSGMSSADIGELLDIPSYLAYGESSPENFLVFKPSVLSKKLSKLNGIISVSTKNKRELLSLGLLDKTVDIKVLPNGIDKTKFFKIDKRKARKELGITNDAFIIAFVGSFIERKGVKVLSSVIDDLENIYSFFIGKGPLDPECKNILFKGSVPNKDLYIYLNAADVFVLPTIAEGCSNAIIEAMACGLPIISSDQPFNDDILNNENSIRLNVKETDSIKQTIELLKTNNDLRKKMSNAALISASHLNINQRAKDIIKFMEKEAYKSR